MKTVDANRKEPDRKDTRDETFPLASDRRPSTVVGFRHESLPAPWSRWANRFIIAAIAEGALAVGVSAYLLYAAVYDTPGAAKIVASRGPGTWLTAGEHGFIVLGPPAAAVTSLVYQHLEVYLRAPDGGPRNLVT